MVKKYSSPVVKLAIDLSNNKVQTEFTNGQDAEATLLEEFIKLNGGSTKIDLRSQRRHPELFDVLEEIISIKVEEGLKGDEFFMDHVDYKNTGEGDLNEFVAEDNTQFIVSEMANGVLTPRRQRIGEKTKVSIPTVVRGVRFYEELRRLLAGKTDWNDFITKVSKAVIQERYNRIYTVFSGINATTPGLNSTYVYAGSYDEEKLLDIVSHVEANTGVKAHIVGTKKALRKISTAVVADSQKESYAKVGYYGVVRGVELYDISNVHKIGTDEFIIPDDKVWIIAGDDKFIKFVTEGDGYILDKDSSANADMSQEYTYLEATGCGLLFSQKIGVYTIQ